MERRKEELSILLFDDENPHQQESYSLHPGKLLMLIAGFNIVIIIMLMFLLYITPFGTFLFNKEDRNVRASVIEVHERIQALQDSLNARDQQMNEIQRVFRSNTDTTFDIRSSAEWKAVYGEVQEASEVMTFQVSKNSDIKTLNSEQIIHSDLFGQNIMFPVEPPVQGSLTGTYSADKRHFGIDIAATKGADVLAVGDGVVIGSDWTINNGYVMHIHHGDGLVSIYKHFSMVLYQVGDTVTKGDIIGKVGETGLLASGPHIHFELWKNGSSLDPSLYINLY
ncbi:MAG: M23 family metallopeptidase [Balneolales bacterium]